MSAAIELHLSELPLEIIAAHGAAVKMMTLVGFTALLYDHALTFVDEVNLIWKTKLGIVSTIFLTNRYVTPLILAVDVYESSGVRDSSLVFCQVWTIVQSFLTIASYVSIQAIVAWRVYAFSHGQRWVGWLLWIAGSLNLLGSLAIATLSLITIIPNTRPSHHACVGKAPSFIWAVWLPSVLFEILLFLLTVKAMHHQARHQSLSTLSLLLYRDGMLYFVAVTLCSMFSLLVWALAPPTLLGLARYFALAMVNIAGSRLVLNLKSFAAAARRGGDDDSDSWEETPPPSTPQSLNPPPGPLRFRSCDGDLEAAVAKPTASDEYDMELCAIERELQQIGARFLSAASTWKDLPAPTFGMDLGVDWEFTLDDAEGSGVEWDSVGVRTGFSDAMDTEVIEGTDDVICTNR